MHPVLHHLSIPRVLGCESGVWVPKVDGKGVVDCRNKKGVLDSSRSAAL